MYDWITILYFNKIFKKKRKEERDTARRPAGEDTEGRWPSD